MSAEWRIWVVAIEASPTAAVIRAASAGFATPFGYQTNVIVYQMAGYRYIDFVCVGLPLNIITCTVAVAAIQIVFPF